MDSRSRVNSLPAGSSDPPDLTNTLQLDTKRIIGQGSFGIVYQCLCPHNNKVAVKAIVFPSHLIQSEKDMFMRKMRREIRIWRELNHPNIVPLLGTARGSDFGSDHPCMVAMWVPNGTLADYVKGDTVPLSASSRIQLIKGCTAGLEYLHFKHLVHGDFHPGNILIDSNHNPRITDFGFSQALRAVQSYPSYLWTSSILPGAVLWAAPELLHPDLYSDVEHEATLCSDIYSLGSIILFILSGKNPWPHRGEAECKLRQLQNPPRPPWPVNIPDSVWNFIERCWSPQSPCDRPLAQEVRLFSRDRLEQLLQPNPVSIINVVLFGALGCGKSSVINLLAGKSVAQVSTNMEPCTNRSRCYRISIGERQFRLWDTTGFGLSRDGDINPLSPYEQAYAVSQNPPGGVNLILLCARKDEISRSLRGLYWLINDFFFGGRAPIAFVLTHFDVPDEQWWEHNHHIIAERTGIPVLTIPRAFTTTVQAGRHQSKQELERLLTEYATAATPTALRLDPSSDDVATLDFVNRCGLTRPEAAELVDIVSRPLHHINVIFFGEAKVGKSSVINLIAGQPVAQVASGIDLCTLDAYSYTINTGMQQFQIWDTVAFNGSLTSHDVCEKAMESAVRLFRGLDSREGGADLLVFIKKPGEPTPSELNCYRLFVEFFCKRQVPVAVIVTHLEGHEPMEKWWEMHGEGLLEAIGGDVIGHACVTSLAANDPRDAHQNLLSSSRLSVQAMLEDCVSSRSRLATRRTKGGSAESHLKRSLGGMGSVRGKKVRSLQLMNRYGLTREAAKKLKKLYYSGG